MVVGMAEDLGTTWCCTCGRTNVTSSSEFLSLAVRVSHHDKDSWMQRFHRTAQGVCWRIKFVFS